MPDTWFKRKKIEHKKWPGPAPEPPKEKKAPTFGSKSGHTSRNVGTVSVKVTIPTTMFATCSMDTIGKIEDQLRSLEMHKGIAVSASATDEGGLTYTLTGRPADVEQAREYLIDAFGLQP